MNPNNKFHYWFFKNAIPSKMCDDIIKLGLEKKPKLAETDGYQQKKVSNKTAFPCLTPYLYK